MAKTKTIYRCQSCGHTYPKLLGRCSECGEWGSFVEETMQSSAPLPAGAITSQSTVALASVANSAALKLRNKALMNRLSVKNPVVLKA